MILIYKKTNFKKSFTKTQLAREIGCSKSNETLRKLFAKLVVLNILKYINSEGREDFYDIDYDKLANDGIEESDIFDWGFEYMKKRRPWWFNY